MEDYKFEVGGVYYVTRNYAMFNKLLGNRGVTDARVNSIITSINNVGLRISPILANEKLEVIDGQGRLEACTRLKMPVYFIVQEGLGVDDCIAMNMKMKNWSMHDFIDSYADRGFSDYVTLRELIREFKDVPAQTVGGLAFGNYTAENANRAICDGRFVMKADVAELRRSLAFASKIRRECKKISSSHHLFAVVFCLRQRGASSTRLEDVIINNEDKICVPHKVRDIIAAIEKAYNFRLSANNKIYFAHEYELACASSSASYNNRWIKKRKEE